MLPLFVVCSLRIMYPPPSKETVWFGVPVTTTLCPLTTRPSIFALPVLPLPQYAVASAVTKAAPMVLPATVSLRLDREAWARVERPPPAAVADSASPQRNPGKDRTHK